jgi:hypothetical protein
LFFLIRRAWNKGFKFFFLNFYFITSFQ